MGVVEDPSVAHSEDCRVLQIPPGVHSKPLGHLLFDYSLPLLCVVMVRAFLQLAALHSESIDPPRSSVLELTVDLD
jgi:hypothetical protein